MPWAAKISPGQKDFPDEKGIETSESPRAKNPKDPVWKTSPMRRGLKRDVTDCVPHSQIRIRVWKTSPMRRGLKRLCLLSQPFAYRLAGLEDFPDEKGIEAYRLGSQSRTYVHRLQDFPDEKGIETLQ